MVFRVVVQQVLKRTNPNFTRKAGALKERGLTHWSMLCMLAARPRRLRDAADRMTNKQVPVIPPRPIITVI